MKTKCQTVLAAAVGMCLAACGGTSDSSPPTAQSLQTACPGIAGTHVAASQIGLPSGAATVASATFVAAAAQTVSGGVTTPATPSYCRVLGTIAPLDPQAQLINFQVNLPIDWNGKAVQYGGGGYNGTLVTGMTPLRDANPDDALPITRGYATLGTDSGHQASAFAANAIGQFGMNDEMLLNYGYASYKKVRDVAVQLMRSFYRQPPAKVYYFGGSEGGREGLTMAQRFPQDYDGVVSVVPVVQLSMLFQSYLPHVRPQFSGGWMSPAKITTLARHTIGACDALDGLADGVVNNYRACTADRVNIDALRCAGGTDTGNDCLSDAQLAAVQSVRQPYTLPFAVANGATSYPGWNFFGNETTPDTVNPTWTRWIFGAAQPGAAVEATSGQQWLYGANFVRYFVARNAALDPLTFDPANYQARLKEVSAIIDSNNPDLRAFFARGGKLIMRENTADAAQSAQAGIDYFNAVGATVGAATLEGSARLYMSPGSTHTGHGTSVTDGSAIATMVDLLDPLDRWVSAGQAPADALVQTVKAATPPFALQAARPMCRYPGYPAYTGGDAKSASSYRCTLSAP